MIQTEFRLGNYVHSSEYANDIFEIVSLSKFDPKVDLIDLAGYKHQSNISMLMPVVFTKQWLIEFRFKEKKPDRWIKEHIKGNLHYTDLEIETNYFKKELIFRCHLQQNAIHFIEKVHKLQNLYFALNNEELIRQVSNSTPASV